VLGGSRLRISGAAEDAVFAEGVKNAAFDSNESDEEYRKRMAVFLEAIRDEGMERVLAEKMLNPVRVAMTNDAGEYVFEVNDKGEFVLDEHGGRVHKFVEYTKINEFYAAMYNMLSQVNRLSHINGNEARILYWQAEDMVSDLMMSQPRSRLNSGEIAYMESLLSVFHVLLMDATDGKKLKALLTIKKEASQNIAVGPVGEKKVF
jgi:hypothetical protein